MDIAGAGDSSTKARLEMLRLVRDKFYISCMSKHADLSTSVVRPMLFEALTLTKIRSL